MTSELDYLDAKVMELFGVASEQHAAQPQPIVSLFDHISTRPGLDEAAIGIELDESEEFFHKDVVDKALLIIAAAKDQSTQLLRAAVVVIPPDLPASAHADVLRASTTLGRFFGAISHYPLKNAWTTNDEVILSRLTARPTINFEYNAQHNRAQYSADGLAVIRPHMGKGRCPALNQRVTTIEGKADLFAIGWKGFTETFLQRQGVVTVNYDAAPDKIPTLL